jgi:transcription elongation factor GreA
VIDVAKLNGTTIARRDRHPRSMKTPKKRASFQLVGESEADVKSGKVSITSPTARALIGKKAATASK